jgi:alkanesulfonate monooxygenase SsuD/methylene tetrahydromethanopterin reductase-like flavin-dependent oxidoreductase (luciferase family)
MRRKAFVGTADHVAGQLRELAARFEMDELVVNTWSHDPAARRRSYALLAGASRSRRHAPRGIRGGAGQNL